MWLSLAYSFPRSICKWRVEMAYWQMVLNGHWYCDKCSGLGSSWTCTAANHTRSITITTTTTITTTSFWPVLPVNVHLSPMSCYMRNSYGGTNHLTPWNSVLKKLIVLHQVKFLAFYGTQGSLMYSQKPATCPYRKVDLWSLRQPIPFP